MFIFKKEGNAQQEYLTHKEYFMLKCSKLLK